MTDPTKELTPEAREKVAHRDEIERLKAREKDLMEREQNLYDHAHETITQRDEVVALLREARQWVDDADLAERIDALLARIDSADEGHALVETMGHIDGMDAELPTVQEIQDAEGAGEKPDPARPEADPVAADASADSPAPTLALPLSVGAIEAQRGNPVIWLEDAEGFRFPAIAHTQKNYARLFDIKEAVDGWYGGHGTPEGELAATQAAVEGLSDENAQLRQRVEELESQDLYIRMWGDLDNARRRIAELEHCLEQERALRQREIKRIAELEAEQDALQENIDPLRDGFNQSQAVVRRLRTALEEVQNTLYDLDLEDYERIAKSHKIIDAALAKETDTTLTEDDDGQGFAKQPTAHHHSSHGDGDDSDSSDVGPAEVTPFELERSYTRDEDGNPIGVRVAHDRNAAKIEAEVRSWRESK